jgi:hypothetical protein
MIAIKLSFSRFAMNDKNITSSISVTAIVVKVICGNGIIELFLKLKLVVIF